MANGRLGDLRRLVQQLIGRGVRFEFIKEELAFAGGEPLMGSLLLSVIGAFAELRHNVENRLSKDA